MSTLVLEVVEGPDAGRTMALAGVLEVGRGAGVDLRLTDELVSRHHARIRADAGGAVIEDLGSSNGTFVNEDEVVEPTALTAGDTVRIGSSVLRLIGVAAPAAAAPAARPVAAPPLVPAPALAPVCGVPEESAAPVAGAPTEAAAPSASEPGIGAELAGYRLEELIGRGGMGVVYRAEDLRLGRKVALKLVPPALVANDAFRERFASESRLAAAIDHPNIIPLYEGGEADGMLFLAMRFVDGIDLKALLDGGGPLEFNRVLSIVAQIGGALDAAHARGLVHRDVKPANVLVASGAGREASDHCYLTDFGLAKDTSSAQRLTGTGQFVGTIDYVAPEQIQGDTPTGAADQYSLGGVMYECLTGHPPFERQSELDVMWAHLNTDPPKPTERRPDLPPGIDEVVARAMAKVPQDRYASCAEMAAAARSLMERRRRPRD